MGSTVDRVAKGRGHDIVASFDVDNPLTEASGAEALNESEVVIEFSLPSAVLENIERYCEWGVTAVVGTTGWYDSMDQVARLVSASDAAVLYAPNFSLGIALVVRAIRAMAPLLDRLPEYDAFVHEVHHVRKVDSPSGTALMLGQTLVDSIERKRRIETEAVHGRIDPDVIHVSSTRAGTVFGTHTVGIDSAFDRISLMHDAKGREGFAFGAVKAAEWLRGRRGLYTLDDALADWVA